MPFPQMTAEQDAIIKTLAARPFTTEFGATAELTAFVGAHGSISPSAPHILNHTLHTPEVIPSLEGATATTPFLLAVKYQNVHMAGALHHFKDTDNETPRNALTSLHIAAANGDEAMVIFLFRERCSLIYLKRRHCDGDGGETAQQIATARGHSVIAALIADKIVTAEAMRLPGTPARVSRTATLPWQPRPAMVAAGQCAEVP